MRANLQVLPASHMHIDSENHFDSQVQSPQSSAPPVHSELQVSPRRSNRLTGFVPDCLSPTQLPIKPHSSRGRTSGRYSNSRARPARQSPSNISTGSPSSSSLLDTPRNMQVISLQIYCCRFSFIGSRCSSPHYSVTPLIPALFHASKNCRSYGGTRHFSSFPL